MRYKLSELKISKAHLTLSGMVLIGCSLSYYAFFYLTRESIRYFSITTDHEIWFLTDTEVWFYNSFYAFIAIILGLSSSAHFLMGRRFKIRRAQTVRTSISNDLRVLSSLFILIATNASVCVSILLIGLDGYKHLNLFPDYAFLFILIALTLFLQVWTNLFRFFKVKRLKVLVISFFTILICALVLGKVNLTRYKSINENVLKNNVYHNYEFTKPKSKTWTYNRYRYHTKQIYIVKSKVDSISASPLLIFETEEIELNELDTLLVKWSSSYDTRMRIQLNIDEATNMKIVNQTKSKIARSGLLNIGYSVVPDIENTSQRKYKHCVILARIINYDFFLLLPLPEKKDSINIKLLDNQYLIENDTVATINFSEKLKEALSHKPQSLMKLNYSDDLPYGQFIKAYAFIKETIDEIRNESAINDYGKTYEYCDYKTKKEIRTKHPFLIEDLNYASIFKS